MGALMAGKEDKKPAKPETKPGLNVPDEMMGALMAGKDEQKKTNVDDKKPGLDVPSDTMSALQAGQDQEKKEKSKQDTDQKKISDKL